MRLRTFFRAPLLLALPLVVAGCAVSLPKQSSLIADGPEFKDPAALRSILPGSVASERLVTGDVIVDIDGTAVGSIEQFVSQLNLSSSKTFTVQKKDGSRETMPFSVLYDTNKHAYNALLVGPGENFTVDTKSISGLDVRAGFLTAGQISGFVAVSRWEIAPSLLEVEVSLTVPESCIDCALRDIALMDWGRRAWLSVAPLDQVAYALLPNLGEPAAPIVVPPPTVVGSSSTTSMNGKVMAHTYGSTTYANYSGTAYTTTTPIYDYSAQYAAAGHNLGVAIRNAQIAQSNRLRYQFALERMGNLRAGNLNPGERVTGHVFFVAPHGFQGPYVVFVDAGDKKVGTVKFD